MGTKQDKLIEKYSKHFSLTEYCGPLQDHLSILKVVHQGPEVDLIVLKTRSMVQYPPKSYGTTRNEYSVYQFDATNSDGVMFMIGFKSLKDLNSWLRGQKRLSSVSCPHCNESANAEYIKEYGVCRDCIDESKVLA